MNRKKLLILATTALISSIATAEEQVSKEGVYIQLNGGISMGLEPKADFGNQKMGNSAIYGAEIGYQFNDLLRISLSVDDRSKYSFTQKQAETDSDGAVTNVNTAWKVRSLVTMVNFYYDVIEYRGFTPYIMAGAGMARNQAKGTQTSTGAYNISQSIPQGTKNDVAYKVGLGAKYELANNVAVNIQYQYIDMGRIKTGTNSGHPSPNNGKIRANEFLAGISYRF